jgi:PKD repeat protein
VYQNSGQYEVSLTVTDNGQSATVTKSAYISSSDNVPAPIYEGFEGGAIPENWKFNHPTGGNFNWTVTNGAGGYGESTYALFFDNYWQDVGNSMDEVWTPKLDISNAPAPELRFDVAYAPYGFPYTDTLAVLISPDCGATWDQIYMKGNTDLATAPATGDPFIPNAEQWRTEILDLSAYTDADEIIIAFRNMGSWGNYIYVDNINLDEDATSVPEHQKSTLAVYPNPTANDIRIRYSGNTSSACTVSIRDASGRLIQEYLAINSNELNGLTISLSQLSQGVYTLSVTAREVQFIERIIKR